MQVDAIGLKKLTEKMMSFSESGDSLCPIAQTLALIGERWTMLILREMFMGSKRFDDLHMYTEISPRLLSIRLKSLESNGLIKRIQYAERPARHEYKLTGKGIDLFPLILSLKAFGDKWAPNRAGQQPAMEVIHASCGHTTGLQLTCTCCGEAYGPRHTSATLSPAFKAERAQKRSKFLAKNRSGAAQITAEIQ